MGNEERRTYERGNVEMSLSKWRKRSIAARTGEIGGRESLDLNRRMDGAFPASWEERGLDECVFARERETERERIQQERRKGAGWRRDHSLDAPFFVYVMVIPFKRMPRIGWSGERSVARWSILPRYIRLGSMSILSFCRKKGPSTFHELTFSS